MDSTITSYMCLCLHCSDRKLDSYCQAELEKENTRLQGDVVRHKKKIGERNCILIKL